MRASDFWRTFSSHPHKAPKRVVSLPCECDECGDDIRTEDQHVYGICMHCVVDAEAAKIERYFKRARYHRDRENRLSMKRELQGADKILDEGFIDGTTCIELQAELDSLVAELIELGESW